MNPPNYGDSAALVMLSRATGRVDADGHKLQIWFAEPAEGAVAVMRSSHPAALATWLIQSGFGAAQVATKMVSHAEDCAMQPYNLPATPVTPARSVMVGTSAEGKRGNTTLEVVFANSAEAQKVRRAFVSEIADIQSGIPPRQAFKPIARPLISANETQIQLSASGEQPAQPRGSVNPSQPS